MDGDVDIPTVVLRRLNCAEQLEDMPTIADRGTSADIVSRRVAELLLEQKVIEHILPPPTDNMFIQFGVQTGRSKVTAMIKGNGLIDEVFVVDDEMPTMLISDISMTKKGVIFVQDDSSLIGVAGGRVVVEGSRDPSASRTSTASMWRLDLKELLQQPDPTIRREKLKKSCDLELEEVVKNIMRLQLQQQQQQQEQQQQQSSLLYVASGATPRFKAEHVRKGRRICKALGMSPYTIANTIEKHGWRDIPDFAHPALFRAIGDAAGNISSRLSTARKKLSGGMGIHDTRVGATFAFDIWGKHVASAGWGCCFAVIIMDVASGYVEVFGIKNKSDLDSVVVRYCQGIEARGKGPVQFARYDAGSEASRHDGDLTKEFLVVVENHHFQLVPSAPEGQKTNTVERRIQTLKHRMANMFLQQDTLTKEFWLYILMGAAVNDRAVCHSGQDRTPCQMMCDFKPNMEHVTQFYTGEVVMCPRVGKTGLLETSHQAATYLFPVLAATGTHIVLLPNKTIPQVRNHLQSIGLSLPEMTAKETEELKPTVDPVSGDLVDFKSRAKRRFTVRTMMQDYDDGVDLGIKDAEFHRELRPYLGPVNSNQPEQDPTAADLEAKANDKTVKQRETRAEAVRRHQDELSSSSSSSANSILAEVDAVDADEQEKELHLEEHEGVLHAGDTLAQIASVVDIALAGALSKSTSGGQDWTSVVDEVMKRTPQHSVFQACKARVLHTADNPTAQMLERDPQLAALWKAAVHKEIVGSIEQGHRFLLTDEEKEQGGWEELDWVLVCKKKRDGTLKARLATDGRAVPSSYFDEDDLFAENVPPMITRLVTAFAARFRMIDASSDVASCFPAQCTWAKSKYPRLICHRLTAFQSPTGQEEWIGSLTNNYGSRDAPGQWGMICKDGLIRKGGLSQSRVCDQLYFRLRGKAGLLILITMTDDFKVLHTNNLDGHQLRVELMLVMQDELKWEMTHQTPTRDYGSFAHEFTTIEGRQAVTLTQPHQIEKTAAIVFGDESLATIPATYTPLPVEWSAEASVQCSTVLPQRQFLKILMSAAWATQTRFESSAVPLLACRSQRPTTVDATALQHFVAYLYTSKNLGITYYEAAEQFPDIRKTVGFRLYTDSGENQHPDGAGHFGTVGYLGETKDGSGAIFAFSQKASGVIGESVPVNEITALANGLKYAVVCKCILEELSGATRSYIDTPELTVEGSAAPMECNVSAAVLTAIEQQEPGCFGCPEMNVAAHFLQQKTQVGPATQVFVDNAGIVAAANHISYKTKGLRRITRMVSHVRSMVVKEIIRVSYVPTEEQLADGLSKQIVSPVQHAESLAAILGQHPAVTQYVLAVHKLFNKRAGGIRPSALPPLLCSPTLNDLGEPTEAVPVFVEPSSDGQAQTEEVIDYLAACSTARTPTTATEKPIAVYKMQTSFPWLQAGRGVPERAMTRQGYRGVGGLGLLEDGIEHPFAVLFRHHTDKGGIGLRSGQVRSVGQEFSRMDKIGGRATIHVARRGGILDSEAEQAKNSMFLAERIRVALMKLTPEERLLFSTRLRNGPLADILITDQQIIRQAATALLRPDEYTTSSVVEEMDTMDDISPTSTETAETSTTISRRKRRRWFERHQVWRKNNNNTETQPSLK